MPLKNYEDQLENSEKFTGDVIIQSKAITDPYLKVFMLYSETIEDRIFAFNTSLKPENDVRGLSNNIIQFDNGIVSKRDSLRQVYLKTFNQIYSISIDSTAYDSEFIITQNIKNELGFETYVDIDSLTKGKHLLKVNRFRIEETDTTNWQVARIPFWVFKN